MRLICIPFGAREFHPYQLINDPELGLTMRRLLSLLVLIIALASTIRAPAAAQTQGPPADSLKRIAIRRLLAVQRTDSLLLAGIESAFAKRAAKQVPAPDMPAGFLDSLRSRVRRDIGQFIERLVPVYDSLYTATEVNDLLAFYQTRLGQRLLETQPRLVDATMLLAQQWGMQEAGLVLVDFAGQPPKRP